MQNFDFYNPTRILFGKRKTGQIGKVTAPYAKKVMLLYGQNSVKRTGLLDKVKKSLDKEGITYVEHGGVKSNPVLSFTRKAIETYRQNSLEGIVALGGGSVIDSAKAIAAGVEYDGDVWDFFEGKAKLTTAAPVTVVLTLAATASEMNGGAVITNEETLQKSSIAGEPLFPKVSILDPVNTFTVPKTYTMYGAVDAVIHLLEGYFNNSGDITPIQDRIVEGLIRTIMDTSRVLFEEPENYNARADMMWSATLGLNGLTNAGIGAVSFPMHMIEHSLSAIYDIAHGAGLSIVAPAWMRYYSEIKPEKFVQFAGRVFHIFEGSEEEIIKKGIDKLEAWFKEIESPVRLSEADIPLEDVSKIAENAASLAKLWRMKDYDQDVIEKILKLAE